MLRVSGPLIAGSVILLSAIIAGSLYSKGVAAANPFKDKGLLSRGLGLPPIWLFYNTGDVNARSWADFGARSSRALNSPYLNLAYDAITRHNADKYRIEVINGVSGLAELLGWEALPEPIRSAGEGGAERNLNGSEMNWVRAAVLARFGGLWLEPSSACLRGFGTLPADKIVFFGTDLDEAVAGPAGTRVPGFRAIWSPTAAHPIFVAWAADAWKQVSGRKAGHLGSAEKWSYLAFAAEKPDVVVSIGAELGRKGAARIQLDDLLETVSPDGELPFTVPEEAIYVPVPWAELDRRRHLGWFLRMSEEQIQESGLVLAALLGARGGPAEPVEA